MKSTAILFLAAALAMGQAWAAGAETSAAIQPDRSEVREIQKSLNDNGFQSGPVDGIMGPRTRTALRNFQATMGIEATGEVDERTVLALGLDPADFARFEEQPKAGELDSEDVRQVQQALNSAGYDAGPVDGIWGERTRSALLDFQQENGLEATGELDQETLLALGFSLSDFAAGEFADEPATNGPSAL